MKFRGNIPAKIDAQGRLKIPSVHRAILNEIYGSDSLYITSLNGDHIIIYPLREWEAIEAKLRDKPAGKAKRKFQQRTGYWGQEAVLDKQDRVLLHPHLRKAAAVDGTDVAVIGSGTYLEVWNDEKLQADIGGDPFTDDDLAELGI
ncbi:MAG: division/cell wall cluster transcriptional repressor MraZ [Acidobacteria bacterium]|nr:MAG: division/cell wall cluster transcriptional repressor MraZ [Acidobacteriota bacterium]